MHQMLALTMKYKKKKKKEFNVSHIYFPKRNNLFVNGLKKSKQEIKKIQKKDSIEHESGFAKTKLQHR